MFALRFPALAGSKLSLRYSRDASYLGAELEIGSYEIGDKEIEVTVDGDTYYSLRDLSEGCALQLLDYGQDTESPDLEIEAGNGEITKYECYEWTVHEVSNFNGEAKID